MSLIMLVIPPVLFFKLTCVSGLPVLIVGVTLAISADKYKAEDHCWLSVTTDTIWAFVGPVLFVLLVCIITVSFAVLLYVNFLKVLRLKHFSVNPLSYLY